MDESTAIVRPSAGVAPEAVLLAPSGAVAALARAVERQLVIAERRGVRLDRIGREVVGRIADRARCDRRGDQSRQRFRFFLGLLFRLSVCFGLCRCLRLGRSLSRRSCLGLRFRIRLRTGICLCRVRDLIRCEYRSDRSIQTGREYRNRAAPVPQRSPQSLR